MTQELTDFIARHEAAVKPQTREAAIAYFDATISGSDETYQKAADLELALSKIYADTAAFATLKEIRASGSIAEPMLARQLEVRSHSRRDAADREASRRHLPAVHDARRV